MYRTPEAIALRRQKRKQKLERQVVASRVTDKQAAPFVRTGDYVKNKDKTLSYVPKEKTLDLIEQRNSLSDAALGTTDKISKKELQEKVRRHGYHALTEILNLMYKSANERIRFDCAKIILDKTLPNLKSVELDGELKNSFVMNFVKYSETDPLVLLEDREKRVNPERKEVEGMPIEVNFPIKKILATEEPVATDLDTMRQVVGNSL